MSQLPSSVRGHAARSIVGALCLAALATASLSAQPVFRGLGVDTSFAFHVNDAGVVVGYGNIGITAAKQAFRWSAHDGLSHLGGNNPWYQSTVATRVSSDGNVIVGQDGGEAYRWTAGTGRALLGIPNGSQISAATGVSANGQVVVGSGFDPNTQVGQAFCWTAQGGMKLLGHLPGANSSFATGVSGDGSAIVGYSGTLDQQAFCWTATGGMVGLGTLQNEPGASSLAEGISADGSTIVGVSSTSDVQQAFRWNSDRGMIALGGPASEPSAAYGVSGHGSIIVGDLFNSNGGHDGFLWTEHSGLRLVSDLMTEWGLGGELAGWSDVGVYGISNNGRYVVGEAFHFDKREAWLLDRGVNAPPIQPPGGGGGMSAVPESSTYATIAAGGLLLLVGWRARAGRRRPAARRING